VRRKSERENCVVQMLSQKSLMNFNFVDIEKDAVVTFKAGFVYEMIKKPGKNGENQMNLSQFIFHVSRTTRCLLRHLIGAHKIDRRFSFIEYFARPHKKKETIKASTLTILKEFFTSRCF
jgi:hypothetical protein